MADTLYYFAGSPFARMARVLVLEWDLPVIAEALDFPPPEFLFEMNPLGQVPVLRLDDGKCLAPTLVVLENLARRAGVKVPAESQQLLTILQAGDALAAAKYQEWCGLGPVRDNVIGYDPGARNLERFARVLDWAEDEIAAGRIGPGITLPGVALACLLFWADAREGPEWRQHPGLAALAAGLEHRDSFVSTVPPAWSP